MTPSDENKSVTRRIYDYILRYPDAQPKEICEALNLDYDKYTNMVSVEKTHVRKSLGLSVTKSYSSKGITAFLLRNPSATAKEICSKLGLEYKQHWQSCVTIRSRLIKRGKIPKPINHFSYDLGRLPNFPFSDSLGYVLGALMGDGYVCRNDKSTWANRVQLGVTNLDFALCFRKRLESWAGKECKFAEKEPVGWGKSKIFVVTLYSSQFYRFFKSLLHDLKNLKRFLKSEVLRVSFLRGYFDADGSLAVIRDKRKKSCCKCELRLTDKNKYNLLFAWKVLNSLGIIPTNIYERKGRNSCFLAISQKLMIWRFRQIVGFEIPYKVEALREAPLCER